MAAGSAIWPFHASLPTQTITVGVASAATQLNGVAALHNPRQVELQNNGTAVVFVDWGGSGVATTVATGYPILPGQSKIVTIPASATYIATISGTAGQTLYVSQGGGF